MDTSLSLVIGVIAVGLLLGIMIGLLLRRSRADAPPAMEAPTVLVEDPSAVLPDAAVTLEDLAVWEVEVPAPATGRLHRLRSRLARSQSTLGSGLLSLLTRERVDAGTWDEVEELLLTSDLGVGPTRELLERLRAKVRVEGSQDPREVRTLLREELLAMVGPELDRTIRSSVGGRPAVVLVVGVNGTGKTTTTGKLARVLIAQDRTVLLGAADTFRAAAAEQLQTWGDRVGAPVVRGPEGADPAAVAFDAVSTAADAELDAVIIDTAGRLHTKTGLMDELGKIKRVVEKRSAVDEVLLVLDATTGQNGLTQARVFSEAVAVTGIVLTKLDGTAKGGIVVAVQRELGVPVKLAGLGEGPDDLAPFEPGDFVDALLAES
ncbi:MAG: signal recognition particle-docking protein FtsY [Actinobacteria bacterium]|nr:signal recognition particle-docking protein FtsY [Actinomycetota bacterium]